VLVKDEEIADAIFNHFNTILGTRCEQLCHLNLEQLNLIPLEDANLDHCFGEDEIWQAIADMPSDKAPEPDGFTGLFYKTACSIIKGDIFRAFQALWSLDGRSFYLVNQAYMVLLRKKQGPSAIRDYRPISLIHSFAKLFTKVLARRLAPYMQNIVQHNQSAFIQTRLIHENYRAVHLTSRLLHRAKIPCALIKVDIAKAFDTVNWPFFSQFVTAPWFLKAVVRLDFPLAVICKHKSNP